MKHSILFFLIACSSFCYSQSNEFNVYPNGLIYDESTMNRLGVIVDSLNIRFKSCDLSNPYYSFPQGMATLVDIPNKSALKLISEGIKLEAFKKEYPKINYQELWIVRTPYENYKGEKYIEYEGLPSDWRNEVSIRLQHKKNNIKTSGWIVSENNKRAFYFENLKSYELPIEYARLIQYVDCMVDTSAQIYSPSAVGKTYQQVDENSKAHKFILWAEDYDDEPPYPDYKKIEELELDYDSAYKAYYSIWRSWDSLRLIDLDKRIESTHYWKSLLQEAVEESLATGNSSDVFEFYVARYSSKEDALKLKRSRKVMGGCSQDLSPRFHAMSICQLAAETTQWDIFLRSHLDIMNDRFERMSDGSYAYGGRKTYLKELEELDIEAVDLLLGTCFRVENINNNHYYGSISRVGRALSDVADKEALEEKVILMMQDERLDPFNRLLLAYLFGNYAYNLEDEERGKNSLAKLESVVREMPAYITEIWKNE